jgi:hypothetical protein
LLLRQIVIEVQTMHVNEVDGKARQGVLEGSLKGSPRFTFRLLVQTPARDLHRYQKPMAPRARGRHYDGAMATANQCAIEAQQHLLCAPGSLRRNLR